MFQVLEDMKRKGAIILDPVRIPELGDILGDGVFWDSFREDLNAYLATRGPDVPVKSLEEVLESRKYHPSIQERMRQAQDVPVHGKDPAAKEVEENVRRLRKAVQRADGATRLV